MKPHKQYKPIKINDIIGSVRTCDNVSFDIGKEYKIIDINESRWLCITETIFQLQDEDYSSIIIPPNKSNPSATLEKDSEFFCKKIFESFSPIKLIHNLIDKCVIDNELIDWDNLDKVINEKNLIKWCKKYALLPYSSKNLLVDINNSYTGISLRALQEEIIYLCLLYDVWWTVTGQKNRIKIKNITNGPKELDVLFWNIQKHPNIDIDDIPNIDIDDIWYSVSYLYKCIIQPSSNYSLQVSNTGIELENEANGIMDLFFINMLVFLTNKFSTDENGKIKSRGKYQKNCQFRDGKGVCGASFWAHDGRQKYCEKHNGKAAYYHNHKQQRRNQQENNTDNKLK